MGETRAPNIRRPPRARESQENHRRDNRGPHPEKGRGKPGGGSSGSHNADIPGGPRRQAHRLRRQPATPEQTGPWARRSKGPPPPSRGPAKPGGPGPAKRPPRVGQRSPEHPAPERETTNALAAGGILHRQGVVVGWGGRMHANKYSRTRPICRHTKMDTVPTITLPICTLYSWIQAPLPPEGQSELNPLHSGVKTGRPPRSPAPAEKTTSPDPDRMASSSSQPPAPDRGQRTENRGCITGEGQDTNHPPPARVKSALLRALNVYVRLNEQTAPWMPFSVPTPKALYVCVMRQRSTTSPASQRHTRTPKPYLYVGVMEQEKGSIRAGEEIIGGGKAGGPGPSRPGPTAARGGPPDPTAEEKLPPPHHLVNSQTTEGNRHPG
ncbi:hypothetical protein M9458_055681 [Cirrhinus mrigala]|uniref:Uncharacterized protein n=1 Tax=Cirrhinus mrigala TaxID=683832 RepID=A0ABD0MJP2_CIRMR